jgi:hypothetical protein
MVKARAKQDALHAVASSPSPYLGWVATNVCICNSQRSSEISCNKCTNVVLLFPAAATTVVSQAAPTVVPP